MSNVDELIAWLLKCEYIQADGGMGTCLDIPKYEVMPKEFLRFAESDLLDKTKKGKVGVLANLKRAIDCQLDIFFEILNLQNIFCGKNLKFEQKTNFIADIGIENGKIKSIEKVLPNGKTTIDASGLTVTPGFIDSHSHSDRNVVTFGVCERLVSCCS